MQKIHEGQLITVKHLGMKVEQKSMWKILLEKKGQKKHKTEILAFSN